MKPIRYKTLDTSYTSYNLGLYNWFAGAFHIPGTNRALYRDAFFTRKDQSGWTWQFERNFPRIPFALIIQLTFDETMLAIIRLNPLYPLAT